MMIFKNEKYTVYEYVFTFFMARLTIVDFLDLYTPSDHIRIRLIYESESFVCLSQTLARKWHILSLVK